jgi:CheY-like chemotaxis protein
MTFSKGGAPIRRIAAVTPIIREACQFALHGSIVEARYDIQQDLWNSNVDRNQLGQVLENLVINALQAMPMGGTIEVTARNVELKEGDHPTLRSGKFVLVSITDHGTGIAPEMLPRVFDPFFTTKSRGHGLGLAISYSIISRHEGALNVRSLLGKGATFEIHLPASEGPCYEPDTPATSAYAGAGRILVMDDEEPVRILLGKMLTSFGHTVVTRADGKETIDFFARETRAGKGFAAVILDLTIPGGMGGKEVAEEIRKIDGETPLFVSSGYAGDPIIAQPQDYGFNASISKPYKMAELMGMLEKHVRTRKE